MFLINILERQQEVLSDLIDETAAILENFSPLPEGSLVPRERKSSKTDYYRQVSEDGKQTLIPLGKTDTRIVVLYKHRKYLLHKLQVLKADKKAVAEKSADEKPVAKKPTAKKPTTKKEAK